MTDTATAIKKEQSNGSSAENQKGIENHKKAATYFEAAAKNHRDAAKHHEEGNQEEAFKSTIIAQGNQRMGSECQKEDVMHHALNN